MVTVWFLVYFMVGGGKYGGDEQITLGLYETQADCVKVKTTSKSTALDCIGATYKEGHVISLFRMKNWT
jgi:hypothetical protein